MSTVTEKVTPFDLEKMCLNWFEAQPYSMSNAKVNLNGVSVQLVGNVQWVKSGPVTQAQRGPVRKATVKFDRNMEDILSDLEISKESATVSDITLTKGVLKGLPTKGRGKEIKLKPPVEGTQAFASGISVKPGQTRTDIKAFRPHISQTQDYTPTRRRGADVTATATITSKESSYKGRFQCTLSLDGIVVFSTPDPRSSTSDEQSIQEIIRDVQRNERQPFFSQDSSGRPSWTLAGDVELRWDEPDNIQWSSQ